MMRTIRGWIQDRKLVSMQKHEVAYIKRQAVRFLKECDGQSEFAKRQLSIGTIRRFCKYILKTHPKTR